MRITLDDLKRYAEYVNATILNTKYEANNVCEKRVHVCYEDDTVLTMSHDFADNSPNAVMTFVSYIDENENMTENPYNETVQAILRNI